MNQDIQQFGAQYEELTQIYRFLRTRNKINPIFLNRNLIFMRHRAIITNTEVKVQRKTFKVDDILEKKNKKTTECQQSSNGFMAITFLGYYQKKGEKTPDKVSAELTLMKTAPMQRKESSPVSNLPIGKCDVPVNPYEEHPPHKATAMSIPSESFSLKSGIQSYSLLVKVYHNTQLNNHNASGMVQPDIFSNEHQKNENTEPSLKRQKISDRINDCNSYKILLGEMVVCENAIQYKINLHDNKDILKLADGQYEFMLREVPKSQEIEVLYESCRPAPILRIKILWKKESKSEDMLGNTRKSNSLKHCSGQSDQPLSIKMIFLYNSSIQKTVVDDNCPFCGLCSKKLYALLKHIRLSHPMFKVNYVPTEDTGLKLQEEPRIEISINKHYDTTFSRKFPENTEKQKFPSTQIMALKPKSTCNENMSEFITGEKSFINGANNKKLTSRVHNRTYHYSSTNLPIPAESIYEPSTEESLAPLWLTRKITRMMFEFTDLNTGEKHFMNLWNLHMQYFNFVGDLQMPEAIEMFIENKGKEMLQNNLYRNFLLHLCNMHQFNVITPTQLCAAITRLQRLIKEQKLHHYLNQHEELINEAFGVDSPTSTQQSSIAGEVSSDSGISSQHMPQWEEIYID